MVTRSVLHVGPGGPGVPGHTHDGSEIEGTADLIHLRVDQLLAGTITGKEVILAGGAAGVIRSDNFVSGVDGWAIFGDGSAELNAVVVRGTIVAGSGSEVDWSFIKNVSIENADIVSLSFDKITAATNTASLVIGAAGSISSSNYSPGTAGWQILGNGDAEFNDVTVRGDIVSGNWDGADPADLATFDSDATEGFYLDSSAGAAQFMGPVRFGGESNARFEFLKVGTAPRLELYTPTVLAGIMAASGNAFWLSGPASGLFLEGDENAFIDLASSEIRFLTSTSAITRATISDTSLSLSVPALLNDGSVAAPALSFNNDTNTGLYLAAGDTLAVAAGASTIVQFALDGSSNQQVLIRDGTEGAPSLSFISDPDTGLYRAAADNPAVAVGGSRVMDWHNNGGNLQARLVDGSATAPALTFIGDPNTGIYRPGSDIVAVATGGALRGSFQADGFYATTPNATGSAANLVTAGAAHNNFMRSTSARRYKTEITYNPEQLLAVELRPAKFYRPDDDAWYYGFIADDLAEEDPLLGTFDPDTGEIENYDSRAVLAVLAAKVNRLEEELARLKEAA